MTDAGEDADGPGSFDADVLEDLFETIEQRKRDLPEDSYTASLFTHEKGENAVLEKNRRGGDRNRPRGQGRRRR